MLLSGQTLACKLVLLSGENAMYVYLIGILFSVLIGKVNLVLMRIGGIPKNTVMGDNFCIILTFVHL